MSSDRKKAGFILCGLYILFLSACGGGGGGGSAPRAPAVVTSTVNTPSATTALINGSVNPNGLAVSDAHFEYGTDSNLTTFSSTSVQSLAAGMVPQAINAAALSLSPGTKYYYRVAATNTVGTSKGTIENFTATTPPPTVHTSTSDPGVDTAVVNGIVNPNGLVTTAWLEYGKDPLLASPTKTANQVIPAGLVGVPIPATLTALDTATRYYYRVAAQSVGGLSNGVINSFTTTSIPPPIADAGTDQSVVIGHPVTLDGSGSSNPYGTNTGYYWTQLSGTPVTLSNPAAVSTTFTAPTVPYPSEVLSFRLEVTDDRPVTGTDIVNVTVNWGALDDFSTDTTGSYEITLHGTAAAFVYDSAGKRLQIVAGNDNHVYFVQGLPATNQGVFSLDFIPTVKYPSGGGIWIRLMQDDNNFYEVKNFNWNDPDPLAPHPDTALVRKVVAGVDVQQKLFTNSYAQGNTHHIKITFSPSEMIVEAFGELIRLGLNTTSIPVSKFEVHFGQQDGYADNILLEAMP